VVTHCSFSSLMTSIVLYRSAKIMCDIIFYLQVFHGLHGTFDEENNILLLF
jgi:hypothetical protein